MVTDGDGRRAEDIIKDVLAREAPEELARFDLVSAAFFEDPERALRASPRRDKPAGFGVSELHTLIAIVLLNAFYALLADQAKDASARAGKGAWRWLKSRRKPRAGREVLEGRVADTDENARAIGEHVSMTFIELGGDPDTAARISAVVIEVFRKTGDDSSG